MTRRKKFYFLFGLLFFILTLATLAIGDIPMDTTLQGALQRIFHGSTEWNPLLDERLPRLIVILCTGASLAVSGAVMQALFHNPLASPSILGITSGGSLAVMLLFIFGIHYQFPFAIPFSSAAGCLTALLVVYLFSYAHGGARTISLILAGIAISTLLTSIQSAIMYAYRDHWQLIQTLTEWEAGSTVDRSWQHVHMQLPLAIVGLAGCWLYRKEINILALGEEDAINLGVDVKAVRWRLFLCISLLIGGALAAVGIIAYFGLVLPHLIRKIQGPDNRSLIPSCMLIGSILLTGLDLIIRFFHIHALSIGNISAVIGAAFFLVLLFESHEMKQRRMVWQS